MNIVSIIFMTAEYGLRKSAIPCHLTFDCLHFLSVIKRFAIIAFLEGHALQVSENYSSVQKAMFSPYPTPRTRVKVRAHAPCPTSSGSRLNPDEKQWSSCRWKWTPLLLQEAAAEHSWGYRSSRHRGGTSTRSSSRFPKAQPHALVLFLVGVKWTP